jgi:hypothetical protein
MWQHFPQLEAGSKLGKIEKGKNQKISMEVLADPPPEEKEMTEQLVPAVKHCHRAGWHCADLSEDNIRYRKTDKKFVIIDFGKWELVGKRKIVLKAETANEETNKSYTALAVNFSNRPWQVF